MVRTEISVTKARDLLQRVDIGDEVDRHQALIANQLIDEIARLDTTMKISKQRVAAAVAA